MSEEGVRCIGARVAGIYELPGMERDGAQVFWNYSKCSQPLISISPLT